MGSARQLAVSPVVSKLEWREFHAFKDRLYRDDPCYVRPLNFQRLAQLDDQRNPFYQHASRQAFLCRSDGRVVGRIAAIVDRLHQQHYNDKVGCFGFFECENDPAIARLLLAAAQQWLAERGCNAIRGPVNPSMKSDFGVLVEGNQYSPYIMMGHTPSYYHELLLGSGFEVVRSFLALAMQALDDRLSYRQNWDDYESLCQRIRDRYPQIKIRTGNENDLESDIRRINELGDEVRNTGWGFVPFTPEELDNMVVQLKRILKPDHAFLAEVDGRLVGYLMALPDLNWALQRSRGPWDWLRMPQLLYWLRRTKRFRVIGLGVMPEYRHSGLAGLLIKKVYDDLGSKKYDAWELSWVDSENIRSIRSIQGFVPVEPYKKYHLYQRPIPLENKS